MRLTLLRTAQYVKSDGILGLLYHEGCTPPTSTYDTLESYSHMIPDGTYPITMTYSPKFRRQLPLINNVPHRTRILIHPGNLPTDTLGCILVGRHVPGKAQLLQSRVFTDKLIQEIAAAISNDEEVTINIITQPRFARIL